MKKLTQSEISEILKLHKMWIEKDLVGVRADLRGANLQGADLQEADLRGADLQGADLQRADLRGANLQEADLREANLQEAYLQRANLQRADLQGVDLQRADLRGANLQEADLDFSCLPLWCGSFKMKIDDRLVAQIVCHLTRFDSSECSTESKKIMKMLKPFANNFCKYRNDVKELE
jgi:hypothetical protein